MRSRQEHKSWRSSLTRYSFEDFNICFIFFGLSLFFDTKVSAVIFQLRDSFWSPSALAHAFTVSLEALAILIHTAFLSAAVVPSIESNLVGHSFILLLCPFLGRRKWFLWQHLLRFMPKESELLHQQDCVLLFQWRPVCHMLSVLLVWLHLSRFTQRRYIETLLPSPPNWTIQWPKTKSWALVYCFFTTTFEYLSSSMLLFSLQFDYILARFFSSYIVPNNFL